MDALGDLFGSILDRAGPERARALKLKARWRQVAGPMIASRARAELSGGTVVLHATDPRWVAELRRLAPELKRRLTAAIGQIDAVDVLCDRSGGAPPAPETGTEATPSPLDPAVDSAAAGIGDPALRERLKSVAARYLAAAARRERGGPRS